MRKDYCRIKYYVWELDICFYEFPIRSGMTIGGENCIYGKN
jgi:hypothetical protein